MVGSRTLFLETKVCTKCNLEKSIVAFHIRKNYKQNTQSRCKECVRKYNRDWKKSNKDKVQENIIKWNILNRDKRNMYNRTWKKENPCKVNNINSKRRATKINATPLWSELDKISLLYKKAKDLEKITGIKYHVDHIIPLNNIFE